MLRKQKMESPMTAFVAGSLAALSAWVINRFMVRRWGDQAIGVIVPIIEELLKTLMAVLLGTSIFYAHFTFGTLEAIWDMKTNIKGFRPAVFSLVTHSVFGFITILILNLTGSLILGIILSIITHMCWNVFIVKLTIH